MVHPIRSELASESQRAAAGSTYTLATVDHDVHNPSSPLLTPATPNYGATVPRSPTGPINSRRIVFNAMLKLAVMMVVGTAFLGGVLWLALPTLEECVQSAVGACSC